MRRLSESSQRTKADAAKQRQRGDLYLDWSWACEHKESCGRGASELSSRSCRSPSSRPPAMFRHTLHNVDFQALHRHLRRDPQVRTGHPNDLRRFRHWYQNGVWKRMLTAVADERANLARVHLDSSHVHCHINTQRGRDCEWPRDTGPGLQPGRLRHQVAHPGRHGRAAVGGIAPRPRAGGPGLHTYSLRCFIIEQGRRTGDSGSAQPQGAHQPRPGAQHCGTRHRLRQAVPWSRASRRPLPLPGSCTVRCRVPLAAKGFCRQWPHAIVL